MSYRFNQAAMASLRTGGSGGGGKGGGGGGSKAGGGHCGGGGNDGGGWNLVSLGVAPEIEAPKYPVFGLFTEKLNTEKQCNAIKTFGWAAAKDGDLSSRDQIDSLMSLLKLDRSTAQADIHDCPKTLRSDVTRMFPQLADTQRPGGPMGAVSDQRPLSVVTFSHKTETDMGAWSENMELERDKLTAKFIDTATAVCAQLKKAGYWADFIDPASGRPYMGPFTNFTLIETDERYKHFGYNIEDLGCCKVIKHVLWGRNVFVGTLFTDAPPNFAPLKQMVDDVFN